MIVQRSTNNGLREDLKACTDKNKPTPTPPSPPSSTTVKSEETTDGKEKDDKNKGDKGKKGETVKAPPAIEARDSSSDEQRQAGSESTQQDEDQPNDNFEAQNSQAKLTDSERSNYRTNLSRFAMQ